MRPIERVLDRLENVRRQNGYAMASCPSPSHGQGRGDRNPSLSISEGADGRALIKCQAGCSNEEILAAIGLERKDLYPKGARGRGEAGPQKKRENVETHGCTLAAYAEAKRLPLDFLKSLGVGEIPNYNGHPAVRMPYLSPEGEEVCVRFRVSLTGKPKVKTRRGGKLTLYGLDRLDMAREHGYVLAVEGESDAQTLWHHDFPAIGVPGASSWRSEWSERLEGIEKIYVVIEPDQGGEQLWERLAASPICERLYRVTLGEFKDVSELHLSDPERFKERFKAALEKAISWLDIAESEAQQEAREAWALCEDLANEERILDVFAKDLNASGVAGEAKVGQILYLALTSRLLEAKQLVNVAVKGPSSGGKSFVVEKVAEFFPGDAYYFLTAMSERALAYSEEPLRHRFLILAEADGMADALQTYLIRSLLSEARLRYETVEKTPEGLRARVIERDGPTGLIVTTTRAKLHNENETRQLSVTVDDSTEHTKEILATLADEDHEAPDMARWHALQVWVAGGETRVTIPYSKRLADLIPPVAVRLRRDFGTLLNLIRSHALLHRATRERDARGRIVATVEDYRVVRDLVGDVIAEGAERTVSPVVRETVEAARRLLADADGKPITRSAIGQELGLDSNATYRRVELALQGGYLRNLEDRPRRPAQLVAGDPLPEDRAVLPDPRDLEAHDPTFPSFEVFSEGNTPPPPYEHLDPDGMYRGHAPGEDRLEI